jgi:hypothetical protein
MYCFDEKITLTIQQKCQRMSNPGRKEATALDADDQGASAQQSALFAKKWYQVADAGLSHRQKNSALSIAAQTKVEMTRGTLIVET